MDQAVQGLGQLADAKNTIAQASKGVSASSIITTTAIVAMSILLIVVGSLSMRIYQTCSRGGAISANINQYAAIIAIGLGVGLVSYLMLQALFNWVEALPLILLSGGAILVGAVNIGLRNSNHEDAAQAFNTGVLGVGLGLVLGFGLKLLKWIPASFRIQALGMIAALSVSVFSIFGINTYQKCDKPTKGKSSVVGLGVLLALGLLAAVGFGVLMLL